MLWNAFAITTSLACYTHLFGPMVATCLLFGLYVHALGHVFTANHFGAEASIRFLPALGVTELMDLSGLSKHARQKVFLMGPISGFGFATILIGLSWFTDITSMKHAGLALAGFNLWNLLPLYPLDGGRLLAEVLKRSPS